MVDLEKHDFVIPTKEIRKHEEIATKWEKSEVSPGFLFSYKSNLVNQPPPAVII